jgi:hypothetical protein
MNSRTRCVNIRSICKIWFERATSVRRQRIVQYCFIVLVGALLIFDAVETERHRYVNLAIVAIMVGGVAFDWIRARRRRTKP